MLPGRLQDGPAGCRPEGDDEQDEEKSHLGGDPFDGGGEFRGREDGEGAAFVVDAVGDGPVGPGAGEAAGVEDLAGVRVQSGQAAAAAVGIRQGEGAVGAVGDAAIGPEAQEGGPVAEAIRGEGDRMGDAPEAIAIGGGRGAAAEGSVGGFVAGVVPGEFAGGMEDGVGPGEAEEAQGSGEVDGLGGGGAEQHPVFFDALAGGGEGEGPGRSGGEEGLGVQFLEVLGVFVIAPAGVPVEIETAGPGVEAGVGEPEGSGGGAGDVVGPGDGGAGEDAELGVEAAEADAADAIGEDGAVGEEEAVTVCENGGVEDAKRGRDSGGEPCRGK